METIVELSKGKTHAITAVGSTYNFYKSTVPPTIGTMVVIYNKDVLKGIASLWRSLEQDMPETTSYEHKEFCNIVPPTEIDEFSKEHGLERGLETYLNVACSIFKRAKFALSLSEDPDIDSYIKITLNIKIRVDIDTLIQKDKEFFMAVDSLIPDAQKEFFIKTYEIVE